MTVTHDRYMWHRYTGYVGTPPVRAAKFWGPFLERLSFGALSLERLNDRAPQILPPPMFVGGSFTPRRPAAVGRWSASRNANGAVHNDNKPRAISRLYSQKPDISQASPI